MRLISIFFGMFEGSGMYVLQQHFFTVKKNRCLPHSSLQMVTSGVSSFFLIILGFQHTQRLHKKNITKTQTHKLSLAYKTHISLSPIQYTYTLLHDVCKTVTNERCCSDRMNRQQRKLPRPHRQLCNKHIYQVFAIILHF